METFKLRHEAGVEDFGGLLCVSQWVQTVNKEELAISATGRGDGAFETGGK